MKKHKHLGAIFFLLIILCYINPSYGAEEDQTALANYLKDMGLFEGTGISYELQANTNRVQAATMIVRLLGKKEEALSMNYPHPFQDVPKWANPYIGYMYHHRISNGIDELHYGANKQISNLEYMTFLIRTVGYKDDLGDFTWNKSIEKAYSINMLNSEEYKIYRDKKTFTRGDMVYLSYKALTVDFKNEKGLSLLRKLMDEKILPQNALLEYKYAPYQLKYNHKKPIHDLEFQKMIIKTIIDFEESIQIDLSSNQIKDITSNLDQAILKLRDLPGYASAINAWNYTLKGNQLAINFEYRMTKSQFNQAKIIADATVKKLINHTMDDYQRELQIHDYIIDTTTYQENKGNHIYTMYGVLVDQFAVCQGYADSFFYLSTLAGIDSRLVFGDTISGGGYSPHAWNVVKIEGDWYQVDTTWNDPISKDGQAQKNYDYFNITDKEMSKTHRWEIGTYPICTATKNNYYTVNHLLVNGKGDLKRAIGESLLSKKNEIEYKLLHDQINTSGVNSIINSFQTARRYSIYVNEDLGVIKIKDIQY